MPAASASCSSHSSMQFLSHGPRETLLGCAAHLHSTTVPHFQHYSEKFCSTAVLELGVPGRWLRVGHYSTASRNTTGQQVGNNSSLRLSQRSLLCHQPMPLTCKIPAHQFPARRVRSSHALIHHARDQISERFSCPLAQCTRQLKCFRPGHRSHSRGEWPGTF